MMLLLLLPLLYHHDDHDDDDHHYCNPLFLGHSDSSSWHYHLCTQTQRKGAVNCLSLSLSPFLGGAGSLSLSHTLSYYSIRWKPIADVPQCPSKTHSTVPVTDIRVTYMSLLTYPHQSQWIGWTLTMVLKLMLKKKKKMMMMYC
jgi:hypothetical protein